MTTMGAQMISDIWPVLTAEGALTALSYRQISLAAITSTNITSTSLGETLYSTSVDVLLSRFNTLEIDNVQVLHGDMEARFPKNILSVTPRVNDQSVALGSTFRVIGVDTPPDGATWALHLRKP